MNIYIYNFIFMIFSFVFFEKFEKIQRYYKYILLLYFIFVFGQRWNAGVDFQGYLLYYLFKFKTEIGYTIIQNYIYDKNLYYGFLIFFSFSFTLITSIVFFSKFCKKNISYFIFFISEYFIMSLNPIRTYIAIQFFIISIWYLYFKKTKLKSIISFIVGLMFHQSIIMVSVFFLYLKKLNFKKKNCILLFFLPLVSLQWLLKYTIYSDYLGGRFDKGMSILNIIKYYIIALSYYILRRNLNRNFLKDRIIDNGMYIFLFLLGLSVRLGMVHRVAYFFKIFEVIFFMYIFENNREKKIRVFIIALFLCNYLAISIKDLGVLKNYRFERLRIYKDRSDKSYYKELKKYLNR